MRNILIFVGVTLVVAIGSFFSWKQYYQCEVLVDGPYIFENDIKYERVALWNCGEKVRTTVFDYEHDTLFEAYGQSISLKEKSPAKISKLNFEGDFKVAAVSDIHGQFDLFINLLKNNHIIDQAGNWSFANGHFVITGDVFDRGDKVTEALWFLYELEQQAQAAGGRVHLLLGNHEAMVLNGDLRYLSQKYVDSSLKLAMSYEALFAQKSVLGDWLRSLPVLVKINNMLFAHGGFHPSLAKDGISLLDINSIFTTNLVKAELNQPRDEMANYLHKSNGPIWYRGYFNEERATDEEINLLLEHFDVDHLVVGHTSQDKIETRYGGKVIAIDASMKNGLYGEVLLNHSNQIFRGTLSGEQIKLLTNDSK